MVEKIKQIRQIMAEQKYLEAQQLIEKALLSQKSLELLGLFLEIHLLQGIPLPHNQTIEYINASEDHHKSLELIQKVQVKSLESRLTEIKLYEGLGDLEELYNKVSDFYVVLYERKIPRDFPELSQIRKKYFSTDFNLELKEFVLKLDRGWNETTESDLRRMIIDCFHKANIKNKDERMERLREVLANFNLKSSSQIYAHFLYLYQAGAVDKSDYKKIIELILYFDDLEFKSLILNLLDRLQLEEIANKYAEIIKKQSNYRFIHFEKYHPHLKKYFVTVGPSQEKETLVEEEIDLSLEGHPDELGDSEWPDDENALASDVELADGLKLLEFNLTGWLNLAVGFLQSDLNKSAFLCATKVKQLASNNTDFLKGSYLAVHALMKLNDYRLALDNCYEAIEKVELETDLLSFYYLEVELLIQLGEKKAAQRVLNNISRIDNTYRLSSKMLKRLNEI